MDLGHFRPIFRGLGLDLGHFGPILTYLVFLVSLGLNVGSMRGSRPRFEPIPGVWAQIWANFGQFGPILGYFGFVFVSLGLNVGSMSGSGPGFEPIFGGLGLDSGVK